MCVDRAGAVESLRLLKSSGFSAYDAAIERAVRGWKFRPFVVNGTATGVCSAVTFLHQQ